MALSKKKLAKKRANKNIKRAKQVKAAKNNKLNSTPLDNYDYNFTKATGKRIADVFQLEGDIDAIPSSNTETHRHYFEYLKEHLPDNYLVKGFDEGGYFEWEDEYYVSEDEIRTKEKQKEYDQLKLEKGAADSVYRVLKLMDIPADNSSIMAMCERVSDNNVFTFPMVDLMGANPDESSDWLIEDYGVWVERL